MAAKLDKDILKQPAPKHPPKLTSRRIGIHTSTAGGVENAAERAYRLGCNTLQIFSSSPRQWKPYELGASQCEAMNGLRQKYDLKPLVIHTNYLVNVAAINPGFHEKSILAFRAEVERALALCADYLVLHPGSYRGMSREEGLQRAAAAIDVAAQGLDLKKGGLTILIENTAGAEFSLGGSFEQVAELLHYLRGIVPVAACLDTCHTHVAGYDIVSDAVAIARPSNRSRAQLGSPTSASGTATMPRRRADRNLIDTSTSGREPSESKHSVVCSTIQSSSTRHSSRRHRSMNRETICAISKR